MKNVGVGIDIVSVQRFRNLPYIKNKSFYRKIFSRSEIRYCLSHQNPSQHFAGKFALKEATKKSIPNKIRMSDIVTSYRMSKPNIKLQNNLHYNFLASVSHDVSIAIAIVISENIKIK